MLSRSIEIWGRYPTQLIVFECDIQDIQRPILFQMNHQVLKHISYLLSPYNGLRITNEEWKKFRLTVKDSNLD